jgi:hypothetical protein
MEEEEIAILAAIMVDLPLIITIVLLLILE